MGDILERANPPRLDILYQGPLEPPPQGHTQEISHGDVAREAPRAQFRELLPIRGSPRVHCRSGGLGRQSQHRPPRPSLGAPVATDSSPDPMGPFPREPAADPPAAGRTPGRCGDPPGAPNASAVVRCGAGLATQLVGPHRDLGLRRAHGLRRTRGHRRSHGVRRPCITAPRLSTALCQRCRRRSSRSRRFSTASTTPASCAPPPPTGWQTGFGRILPGIDRVWPEIHQIWPDVGQTRPGLVRTWSELDQLWPDFGHIRQVAQLRHQNWHRNDQLFPEFCQICATQGGGTIPQIAMARWALGSHGLR